MNKALRDSITSTDICLESKREGKKKHFTLIIGTKKHQSMKKKFESSKSQKNSWDTNYNKDCRKVINFSREIRFYLSRNKSRKDHDQKHSTNAVT